MGGDCNAAVASVLATSPYQPGSEADTSPISCLSRVPLPLDKDTEAEIPHGGVKKNKIRKKSIHNNNSNKNTHNK